MSILVQAQQKEYIVIEVDYDDLQYFNNNEFVKITYKRHERVKFITELLNELSKDGWEYKSVGSGVSVAEQLVVHILEREIPIKEE